MINRVRFRMFFPCWRQPNFTVTVPEFSECFLDLKFLHGSIFRGALSARLDEAYAESDYSPLVIGWHSDASQPSKLLRAHAFRVLKIFARMNQLGGTNLSSQLTWIVWLLGSLQIWWPRLQIPRINRGTRNSGRGAVNVWLRPFRDIVQIPGLGNERLG